MSNIRYEAEYAAGGAVLAASVSETSSSGLVVGGRISASRGVSEASVSSMAPSGARGSFRSVGETSTSSIVVSGFKLGITFTSTSAMGVVVQRGGNATAHEVSVSLVSAVAFQTGFVSESSTSTLTVSSSGGGIRAISEISSSSMATFIKAIVTSLVREKSTSSISTAVVRATYLTQTSVSILTVSSSGTQTVGIQVSVRERLPVRLTMNVVTPDGMHWRWGADDPNSANAPSGINFSTVMPGGHESGSCVLQRTPNQTYPDLRELSKVQVRGLGGFIASEGRLESLPEVGGDQAQVTPSWTGYQAQLADDNSARQIFVDQNITNWIGPSVQRQIQWLQAANPVQASSPSIGPDFSANAIPALQLELDGAWVENQVIEAWYDAHGIDIAALYTEWQGNGMMTLTGGTNFGARTFLCTDDTGTSYDQYPGETLPDTGSYTLNHSAYRPWALIQFWNDQQPGGQDGTKYILWFTGLGVYGSHGQPLYSPPAPGPAYPLGIKASDAIAYMVNTWAPGMAYSTGTNGTIQPSPFIIPQLSFLDPTTAADMIKEATKYELLDWAVWDGPTFYLNPRGGRGKKWRSRIGPAQLQNAGPQISRIWNGVVVQWTDVTGVTRTIGPPGSGTTFTDSSLRDSDSMNPVNAAGINRYALVTMSTSTQAGALQIGQKFLQQQKLLDTAGQATLTGYVQDDVGVWWPTWMVRGGDQISFIDSDDTSYRRIVHTSYDDSSKANAIQLDQPPDSLQALLERLGVSLQRYGIS